jgi:glycosyltransferase involved in cell wall biosynthesis
VIAVIIPVHNEEELLTACLESVVTAIRHPQMEVQECGIIVVLDACSDNSEAIAAGFDVTRLSCQLRCVGAARAIGAEHAIGLGARWLAFTDADTCVAEDWLATQMGLEADAVCGTIGVNWSMAKAPLTNRGTCLERAKLDFERHYVDRDGHRHIHGANLGVSTDAYLAAGGFAHRTCHEDVALVQALTNLGKNIVWSAAPRVITSARVDGRAPEGFAADLRRSANLDAAEPASGI